MKKKIISAINRALSAAPEGQFINLTRGEAKEILRLLTPARVMPWEELIKCTKDQKLWFEIHNQSLEIDSVEYYNPDTDVLEAYNTMSLYKRASVSYNVSWRVWDKLPTEQQMKETSYKKMSA